MIEKNRGKVRLFVPLSSEPFRWFESGKKRWELRRYGRQYTERNIVPGQTIELRRGYQARAGSLWGTITDVVYAPSLDIFFDLVPFKEVVPLCVSRDEAILIASEILHTGRTGAPVLGFKVAL